MTSKLTTEQCIHLIENNENDKLKAVLIDNFKYSNRYDILTSQNNNINLFNIAIKNNNFEAFNILLNYSYLYPDDEFLFNNLFNNLQLFKPKRLKKLLERDFKPSKSFINLLIKKYGNQEYNELTLLLNLLNLIFQYINFNTNLILKFLLKYYCYKNTLSQKELKTIIDKENEKFNAMLNDKCVFETNFNFYSDTPLGISCKNGYEYLLKYFIDHGADPNIRYYRNKYYEYGLDEAIRYGDFYYNNEIELKTPLIYAVENENESLINYLVKHGARIKKHIFYVLNTVEFSSEVEDSRYFSDNRLRYRKTPLSIACEKQNESMIKCLIEHGANVNEKCIIYKFGESSGGDYRCYYSKVNKSPLYIACEQGNESLVKYLVEHGANMNAPHINIDTNDNNSIQVETPFSIALKKGNESLIKYLVDHGAYNYVLIEKKDYKNISLVMDSVYNSSCEKERRCKANWGIEKGMDIKFFKDQNYPYHNKEFSYSIKNNNEKIEFKLKYKQLKYYLYNINNNKI